MKFLCVLALSALCGAAQAGDLVAVEGVGKGGQQLVSLEFLAGPGETAFEFEYVLPQDAKGVDVARCAKAVPATHTAYCDYRPSEQKILVIVTSGNNDPLPESGLDLGFVSYTSKAKPAGDRVTGLVVANERGEKVPSHVHLK